MITITFNKDHSEKLQHVTSLALGTGSRDFDNTLYGLDKYIK